MEDQNLLRLSALIKDQRDELLARWRQQVRQLPAAAKLDLPTINDQVPELLDILAESLKPPNETLETNAIPAEHGVLRWQAGFDVTEVVSEYNILRQCLQDAADKDGISLTGKPLHVINEIFDEVIGKAAKAFETMMTIELQHRHDEHLTFVLHDLRTPLEALALATTLLERSLPENNRNSGTHAALVVLRGNINRLTDRVRHVCCGNHAVVQTFQQEFEHLSRVCVILHQEDCCSRSGTVH